MSLVVSAFISVSFISLACLAIVSVSVCLSHFSLLRAAPEQIRDLDPRGPGEWEAEAEAEVEVGAPAPCEPCPWVPPLPCHPEGGRLLGPSRQAPRALRWYSCLLAAAGAHCEQGR